MKLDDVLLGLMRTVIRVALAIPMSFFVGLMATRAFSADAASFCFVACMVFHVAVAEIKDEIRKKKE